MEIFDCAAPLIEFLDAKNNALADVVQSWLPLIQELT